MKCNCNCNDDNTIQFVQGTTVNLGFNFDEDISSYTDGIFTIRKDFNTPPVINKSISVTDTHTLNVELPKSETNVFNEYQNGKNSAQYIWGLDLVDSVNNVQVNVFPQTGEPAPLCIVSKHVVEES